MAQSCANRSINIVPQNSLLLFLLLLLLNFPVDLTGKPKIVISQSRDTDQQKHTCTTSIRYYSRNQRHKAQIKPSARNPLIMFNNSPNIQSSTWRYIRVILRNILKGKKIYLHTSADINLSLTCLAIFQIYFQNKKSIVEP